MHDNSKVAVKKEELSMSGSCAEGPWPMLRLAGDGCGVAIADRKYYPVTLPAWLS